MKDKKEEQVKVEAKIIVQVKLWNDLLNVANNANRVCVKNLGLGVKFQLNTQCFFVNSICFPNFAFFLVKAFGNAGQE